MRWLPLLLFLPLAAEPLPFGFAPPEIFLTDFGTRSLQSGDLTGNGLPDLALLNPERGRVDLFEHLPPEAPRTAPRQRANRWDPVLADARFERFSLNLTGNLLDLLIADINGDGQEDLLVSTDQNRILIFLGPVQRGARPSHIVESTAVQAAPGSMLWDADHTQLLLLGERELHAATWQADTQSFRVTPLIAVPSGSRPFGLQLRSVDDTRLLLYSLRTPRFPLAVHRLEAGRLGPLTLPWIETPLDRLHPGVSSADLLGVHPRSGLVQQVTLQTKTETAPGEPLPLQPELLPLPGAPQNTSTFWVHLRGPGHEDLLVLTPGQPSLLWMPDGDATRQQTLPIPPGINWALPGRWLPDTEGTQLLLHNQESRFLGLLAYADGRIPFPAAIDNTADILGVAAWRPDGADRDRIVGIVRDQRSFELRVWEVRSEETGLSLHEHQRTPLPFVTRDVFAPLLLPQEEGEPAAFWVSSNFETGFFLLEAEPGTLQVQETAPGNAQHLLRRRRPEDFLLLPPGLPLASRWVLLQDGMAQFLRRAPGGQVMVVDQLNLQGSGRLRGLLPLNADASRIALYDGARNLLEIHERSENEAFRFLREQPLPAIPHRDALLTAEAGSFRLRLSGREIIATLDPAALPLRLDIQPLTESRLLDFRPQFVFPADLNGDGQQDLLLIDAAQTHQVEFLRPSESGEWLSAMHFQIFDQTAMVAGRRGGGLEPREVLVADWNQDGLNDILLLIHDRLLLYLQDPIPE